MWRSSLMSATQDALRLSFTAQFTAQWVRMKG